MLSTQFCNSMFCTAENHGIQMQSKDKPLQICKWNSCSMLFRFLDTISQWKSLENHKHWFCLNDLSCCVRRTSRKFAVAILIVPTVWPIQEGTNLTQNELITLEKASFSFDHLCRSNDQSLFGSQSSCSSNSHVLDAMSCPSLVRPSYANY
jgi:hypothetical protein